MATNSTSFANTPQASDDEFQFTEDELLNGSLYDNLTNTITLDVMSDDLGGKAKKLFSISGADGTDPADLWNALKSTDVGKQPELTAGGNTIQITSDGKIAYTLKDLPGGLNSLSEGEKIIDSFTYAIRLGNGTLSWATVNIEITGSNDRPTDITLSNNTVSENSAGAVIGTVTTTDVDRNDTHTYTVSDSRFEVVNGELKLKAGESLNYEQEQSVDVSVTTDDGHATYTETFTINVTDVNEAPDAGTDQTVAATESVDATTVLATVTATDPDALADTDSDSANDSFNNLRYSISTDDSGKFEIDATTGEVTLKDGASLDYETAQSFTITVAVTDMDGAGLADLVDITINVEDVNEAPNAGTDQTVSTPENVNTTTVIATVTGTDPDILADSDSSSANNAFNNLRYAISADVSGKFEIDAATGAVTLKDGASLDYETTQSHTITVAVTDMDGAGLTDFVDITINVTDVSEGVLVALPYTGDGDPNDFDTLVPSSTTGTSTTTGNDILVDTTPLNQAINLGSGNDVYYAGSEDDAAISGGNGNDTIYGQAGNDSINGNNDLDNIYGGSGNDSLDGNNDADNIYGGSGSDTINGGGGNDIIVGGYGADTLAGGAGADTFSYLSILDTGDVITDWETTDILDFSAIAGITGTTATNTNSVVANSVTYHQDGLNTVIWADTDGNTATAELQVTLTNIVATTLTDSNFNL